MVEIKHERVIEIKIEVVVQDEEALKEMYIETCKRLLKNYPEELEGHIVDTDVGNMVRIIFGPYDCEQNEAYAISQWGYVSRVTWDEIMPSEQDYPTKDKT